MDKILGSGNLEKHVNDIISNEKDHVIHGFLTCNIDNFAFINEMYGHDKGDIVLNAIEEYIGDFFKGTDLVSRVSGDEYEILIQKPKTISDIERICEKVLKAVSEVSVDGISVTMSIGASVYPFHGKTYKELKDKSIQSLVRIKTNGKNFYRIYDSALTKAMFSKFVFNGDYEDFDYRKLNENDWGRYFNDVSLQLLHYDSNAFAATNSILEIFCMYHGYSRAFVVSDRDYKVFSAQMLEFNLPGHEQEPGEIRDIVRNDLVARLFEEKGKHGIVRCSDSLHDSEITEYMLDNDVGEIMFFSYSVLGDNSGAIVFERVGNDYSDISDEKVYELADQIDSVVGLIYLSVNYKASKELLSKIEMFEGIGANVFIIDSLSHNIEYMNRRSRMSTGGSLGQKCYELIHNSECICGECPLKEMSVEDSRANARREGFDFSTCTWSIHLYSWLSGRDNKGKLLLIGIDADNVINSMVE